MEFDTFEPVYRAILADFGFDRAADERARDVAAAYATPFEFGRLAFGGKTVAIAGAAPSLSEELDAVRSADAVLAASTAADVLREAEIPIDCMVTDFDKNPETARDLTREGIPVAAHAHGDNVPLVERWLPAFDPAQTIVTTQAEPVDAVYNVGGFTDGDRAAFLADHCGAADLRFPGWNFDDPSVDPSKRRKLEWAARLLRWLERRRDDRFPILDGRREELDAIVDKWD